MRVEEKRGKVGVPVAASVEPAPAKKEVTGSILVEEIGFVGEVHPTPRRVFARCIVRSPEEVGSDLRDLCLVGPAHWDGIVLSGRMQRKLGLKGHDRVQVTIRKANGGAEEPEEAKDEESDGA